MESSEGAGAAAAAKGGRLPEAGMEAGEGGEFSDSSQEELVEPDELYDEGADDADEAWVAQHYRKEATRHGKGKGPETDAVLNCPCCFTTLCMDCQRHERYKNQYRAMFVVNCTVKTHVQVASPPQPPAQDSKNSKGQGDAAAAAEGEGGEILHPVVCAACGTEVGVQDEEEVVHFFNVLAN